MEEEAGGSVAEDSEVVVMEAAVVVDAVVLEVVTVVEAVVAVVGTADVLHTPLRLTVRFATLTLGSSNDLRLCPSERRSREGILRIVTPRGIWRGAVLWLSDWRTLVEGSARVVGSEERAGRRAKSESEERRMLGDASGV